MKNRNREESRRTGQGGRAMRSGRQRPAVLFETEDIVAVEKPSGLPTISPDGGKGRSLYDFVTDHIRRKNPKGRAAVVHRIDRDSSGVVVFAKNAAAKKGLMGSWNKAISSRRYIALAEGNPEGESGILDSWLRQNAAGTVYETPPGAPGALRAVTRWRCLKSGGGYSLLELELETGRKHQIRVQLAAAGHPVAGDFRYGARTDPAGRLALHAASIEFVWPPGEVPTYVESPVPESFLRPLRAREKGLYYRTSEAGDPGIPPRRIGSGTPGADKKGKGHSPAEGGYMKEKSKQAKEPKKKPQKTLKEKRKEKKEKAANKAEE